MEDKIKYQRDAVLTKRSVNTKRQNPIKGAVSRNSAKLGNNKMPVKLRETQK